MSRFIYCYAECHYAECRYAECRGATSRPGAVAQQVEQAANDPKFVGSTPARLSPGKHSKKILIDVSSRYFHDRWGTSVSIDVD